MAHHAFCPKKTLETISLGGHDNCIQFTGHGFQLSRIGGLHHWLCYRFWGFKRIQTYEREDLQHFPEECLHIGPLGLRHCRFLRLCTVFEMTLFRCDSATN